jgi:hypothetical protein
MKGVSAFIFIAALGCSWAQFQFLNHRPFPMYSLENMPDTMFSCRDKILGGYYADVETMCQMFHICVKVAGVGVSTIASLFGKVALLHSRCKTSGFSVPTERRSTKTTRSAPNGRTSIATSPHCTTPATTSTFTASDQVLSQKL